MRKWLAAGRATLLISSMVSEHHLRRRKEVVGARLVDTPLALLPFSWLLAVGVMVRRPREELSFSNCKAGFGLESFTSHLLGDS